MSKKKKNTEQYLEAVFQLMEELDRLEAEQRQLHLRDRNLFDEYQRKLDAIRERIKDLER
jgi:hypothetical protein